MLYEELDPPVHQHERVLSYWHFAVDDDDPLEFEHVIVPDGTASIVCTWIESEQHLSFNFVGPRSIALRLIVHRGAQYWGVRFRPGASPFHRLESLINQVGPINRFISSCPSLQHLPDRPAAKEVFAGLETIVDHLLIDAPQIDKNIAQAILKIESVRGIKQVSDLARESGISERQFLRRFKAAVGMSPKEYIRMRRIRWACALAVLAADSESWAERAFDGGFADQAHLSREFRRVFGWTPRMTEEYLARIDHKHVNP